MRLTDDSIGNDWKAATEAEKKTYVANKTAKQRTFRLDETKLMADLNCYFDVEIEMFLVKTLRVASEDCAKRQFGPRIISKKGKLKAEIPRKLRLD